MLEFFRGFAYLLGGILTVVAFAAGVVLLLNRVGVLGYAMRPAPMSPPDSWPGDDFGDGWSEAGHSSPLDGHAGGGPH
jgi:hypothetical protein